VFFERNPKQYLSGGAAERSEGFYPRRRMTVYTALIVTNMASPTDRCAGHIALGPVEGQRRWAAAGDGDREIARTELQAPVSDASWPATMPPGSTRRHAGGIECQSSASPAHPGSTSLGQLGNVPHRPWPSLTKARKPNNARRRPSPNPPCSEGPLRNADAGSRRQSPTSGAML
jgi:hypothetical protein